jgi:hypothetical protein
VGANKELAPGWIILVAIEINRFLVISVSVLRKYYPKIGRFTAPPFIKSFITNRVISELPQSTISGTALVAACL